MILIVVPLVIIGIIGIIIVAFSCLAYQNGAKNVVAPVSVSILGAVLLIAGIISAADGSEDSAKLIMCSLALIIVGCIWYFVYKENERNGVYEQEKIAELMQIEKEKDQALESQNQSAPWAKKYMTEACPYCGHYKVRWAKWEDKRASVAFWGGASSKIGANYKCEHCGKMWS